MISRAIRIVGLELLNIIKPSSIQRCNQSFQNGVALS